MENHRRIEVHYSGHVQGVGFRYQALGIARLYDVVGFVRNLDDGRVQLVAEGEKEELLAFLREVNQKMTRFVRHKTVSWHKPSNQFSSFEIRSSALD
jgi:acylphosphatase